MNINRSSVDLATFWGPPYHANKIHGGWDATNLFTAISIQRWIHSCSRFSSLRSLNGRLYAIAKMIFSRRSNRDPQLLKICVECKCVGEIIIVWQYVSASMLFDPSSESYFDLFSNMFHGFEMSTLMFQRDRMYFKHYPNSKTCSWIVLNYRFASGVNCPHV